MMETPIIDRFWAMPSKNTFSIPPFHALIEQYRRDGISIDPFANAARLTAITNDLDPSYDTDYHMDATDGFEKLHIRLVCHGGHHNDTIAVVERKRAKGKAPCAGAFLFSGYKNSSVLDSPGCKSFAQ